MPALTWICFRSPISGPWSQVSERRGASGSVWILRAGDVLGLVAVGQWQQGEAAGALDQRAGRGDVALADQRVAFTVTGQPALVGLGRALTDVDDVGDPVLALADLSAGLAEPQPKNSAPCPKRPGDRGAQIARLARQRSAHRG